MAEQSRLDKVIALARHRGFVFQAGEIYGGSRSAWDYGPLGTGAEGEHPPPVVADVRARPRRHGRPGLLDHPAQARVGGIRPRRDLHRPARGVPAAATSASAPTTSSRTSRPARAARPRTGSPTSPAPNCGTRGQYTEPKAFSGLMKTYLGVVDDESGLHYLRPETAQGIFVELRQRRRPRRARSRRSASARSARRSATRSRPETSSSARASSSRWRSSSSCRPPRRRSGSSTGWRRAGTGSSTSASTRRNMRRFDVPEGRPRALLGRHDRRRVRVRLPRQASGASSWASPTAPTTT